MREKKNRKPFFNTSFKVQGRMSLFYSLVLLRNKGWLENYDQFLS